MKPRRREPEYEVVEDDAGPVSVAPDRANGSTELSQRETFRLLCYDPAVRNYVIAAFSALAMIFLVLFMQGSDFGGLLIVLIGGSGILLRWVAAPVFVLLLLTYFMVFPFGIPGEMFANQDDIRYSRFRPPDLILAMAVLVYVAAQFRIFGFVHQAVAFEGGVRRADEPVTRRPPALITASELGVLLGVSFAVVIGAQLVWSVINSLEVAPGEEFPLNWVGIKRSSRQSDLPGGMTPGLTRFVVLVGLFCFGILLARLVFGYWRLRSMGAAEGAMILLDGGWDETKRERSRQEKWRIWGRKRAEASAKAEAEAAEKAQAGRKR